MKKLSAILLTAAMALSMAACGNSSASTSTTEAASNASESTAETQADTASSEAAESTASNGDLEDFSIVLDWYPNAVHSFIYTAIEKGYYAEEGLNVHVQFPANTNDAITMTAAGQADASLLPAKHHLYFNKSGCSCQDSRYDCAASAEHRHVYEIQQYYLCQRPERQNHRLSGHCRQ